jgi:hypothetical protein
MGEGAQGFEKVLKVLKIPWPGNLSTLPFSANVRTPKAKLAR